MCDYIAVPATISELCCAKLCWAVCHRLWSVTLTELGCARLCRAVYGYGLYGLLSESGYAGLCMAVTLMALYIYWAVLLHSLLCVIYSVEMGFRVFLGCVLCVLG